MKILNQALLKFTRPDWRRDPELALIDIIIEQHSEFLSIVASDVMGSDGEKQFGRKDSPSVEQVMRAAIFKELKSLNYRDLEYAQADSRVCGVFIKLDDRKPFSFQVWQKYISQIKAENLHRLIVEINKIAIHEGFEDLERVRTDTTVIESNIHYPTNQALVWDCTKEAHRLLSQLAEKEGIKVRDYTKGAKSTFFKINNSKADKRVILFKKQLMLFAKSISQVGKFAKKKDYSSLKTIGIIAALQELLPLMEQVYQMTERKQIKGEKVPNDQKVFSIYEKHTDIIVKGGRQVEFGHKVILTDSKSGLILDCGVLKGNPSDKTLFMPAMERVSKEYGRTPKHAVTDGGFADKANHEKASKHGLINIVFNKVTPNMSNIVSSKRMETMLKKWRSGIEACISNLKRGFDISRCTWKGWEHFCSKVMWSVLGYNIRVLTRSVMGQLTPA